MLNQPMSSPMMKTMFGTPPEAVAGVSWAATCAGAAVMPSVAAAAASEPPRRMLRRLTPSTCRSELSGEWLSGPGMVDI